MDDKLIKLLVAAWIEAHFKNITENGRDKTNIAKIG